MAAGIAAWVTVSYHWPDWPGDLIGFAVSLTTMLVATPLTQRIDPPRRLVDHDGNEVALDDRLEDGCGLLGPVEPRPADFLVEGVAGATVEQRGLPAFRQVGQFQHVLDLVLGGTIEHRCGHRHTTFQVV